MPVYSKLSTASALDLYFGNKAGAAYLWHSDRTGILKGKPDYKEMKMEFVAGLRQSLNLPESGGVTRQHLIEMIKVAESGDWADVATVRRVYEAYEGIRRAGLDMHELFDAEFDPPHII